MAARSATARAVVRDSVDTSGEPEGQEDSSSGRPGKGAGTGPRQSQALRSGFLGGLSTWPTWEALPVPVSGAVPPSPPGRAVITTLRKADPADTPPEPPPEPWKGPNNWIPSLGVDLRTPSKCSRCLPRGL